MNSKPFIYLALAVLLAGCGVGFLIVRGGPEFRPQKSKATVSEFPELSNILNKSNNYSFSYIYAQRHRVAAIDDLRAKYFYLYGPKGEPLTIMNSTGSIIWEAGPKP